MIVLTSISMVLLRQETQNQLFWVLLASHGATHCIRDAICDIRQFLRMHFVKCMKHSNNNTVEG